MDRKDKRSRKEVLRMILPHILEVFRGPSLGQKLFQQTIADSIAETHLHSQTLISAFQFMNHPDRYQYFIPAKSLDFSDTCKKTPQDIFEISMLNKEDHWLYLHVSRNVAGIIINNIERIALKKEEEDTTNVRFHDSVMKVPLSVTINLCFWYLRHSNGPLEEAARIFNIDISILLLVIARGMKLLSYLNEDAKVCWPASDEFMKTAVDRFPRLETLIGSDPNAVMAACVTHNYCKHYGC